MTFHQTYHHPAANFRPPCQVPCRTALFKFLTLQRRHRFERGRPHIFGRSQYRLTTLIKGMPARVLDYDALDPVEFRYPDTPAFVIDGPGVFDSASQLLLMPQSARHPAIGVASQVCRTNHHAVEEKKHVLFVPCKTVVAACTGFHAGQIIRQGPPQETLGRNVIIARANIPPPFAALDTGRLQPLVGETTEVSHSQDSPLIFSLGQAHRRFQLVRHTNSHIQFCTFRSGTRWKCLRLRVTTVSPRTSAIEAILMSASPILDFVRIWSSQCV